MAAKRLGYLAALSGCIVFYLAYGEWFSWLLLVLMLLLPWLSLLLSLPGMLSFRISLEGAEDLPPGTPGELRLKGSSPFPAPPFRGRIRLRRCFDGSVFHCESGERIPAEHCGGWVATGEKLRIFDYMGLFSLPVKEPEPKTVVIRPVPVAIDPLPDPERQLAMAWRPKFGGGYAENHELRPYRPGDNLNQIHWKLTAKAGKWMLREPMEPQRGLLLVTMELSGTPEELDRKMGRLLWLGNLLLGKGLAFELRVLTGQGILSEQITRDELLQQQLKRLLCSPQAEESREFRNLSAAWHFHIGGDRDEI